MVSTTAFTLRNSPSSEKGIYIRLVDVSGDSNQADACAEAINSDVDYCFKVGQHEFAQIPGSPIVYWLSKSMLDSFAKNKALKEIAAPRQGLATADNNRFLRDWHEIDYANFCVNAASMQTALSSGCKWFPTQKGGNFRRWYGNHEFVVNWANNGSEIRNFTDSTGKLKSRPQNLDCFFLSGITWTAITTGDISLRYSPSGFISNAKGPEFFPDESIRNILLGICNSSSAQALLTMLAPTLDYSQGPVGSLPIPDFSSLNTKKMVSELIHAAQADWNSYETSWGFQRLALLDSNQGAQVGDSLEDAVFRLREYWDCMSEEQRQREIRNNELVADAYGVRDDVSCDVPLERVSLKRNVAFAYSKDTPEMRNKKFAQDVVKELISYAVGCMFGRYSLDKLGLILASQGETLDDYHARIPNPSFEPDEDNVIPVTETDCFEDDIVTRFRRFLEVAFGKENLAANIAYIEQVLGKSIRKYFVNDFYNDHVKMYSSRPIYWQYSSQTNNKGAFKALVYLHRYTPKTTSTVLNYLRDYINKIADIADGLEHSDRAADQKEAIKLRKAILECKDYEDQTLYPLATRNLEMDLDDGVLVNYLRMGKALRAVPSIERKRKEVSTWTWPVHPLKDLA